MSKVGVNNPLLFNIQAPRYSYLFGNNSTWVMGDEMWKECWRWSNGVREVQERHKWEIRLGLLWVEKRELKSRTEGLSTGIRQLIADFGRDLLGSEVDDLGLFRLLLLVRGTKLVDQLLVATVREVSEVDLRVDVLLVVLVVPSADSTVLVPAAGFGDQLN